MKRVVETSLLVVMILGLLQLSTTSASAVMLLWLGLARIAGPLLHLLSIKVMMVGKQLGLDCFFGAAVLASNSTAYLNAVVSH